MDETDRERAWHRGARACTLAVSLLVWAAPSVRGGWVTALLGASTLMLCALGFRRLHREGHLGKTPAQIHGMARQGGSRRRGLSGLVEVLALAMATAALIRLQ